MNFAYSFDYKKINFKKLNFYKINMMIVDCYCQTKNNEHKKMCITLLKKSTKIQTKHYNNDQLILLKQLQDGNI
jgi:hypothetical protein